MALETYIDAAKRRLAAGDEESLLQDIRGIWCGCMGRRDGDPLCPCGMRAKAAKIVAPHLLKKVIKDRLEENR